MNHYPTQRNYRSGSGTVRGRPERGVPRSRPSGPAPRRTPGRPAARPRPTYRPGAPAKLPKPPGVSRGAIRAAANAFRGLGPLAGAFGVGYMIGSIIFRKYGDEGGLLINNPAGWTEYIAEGQCDPWANLRGPVGTIWAQVPGRHADNNICFQAVPNLGGNSNTSRGFWIDMVNWENSRFTHIASFVRANPIPINPKPTVEIIPPSKPRPAVVTDPWFREQVGPAIRTNPGLAPVIESPVGPEVGPRPSTAPKPVPGVGSEGYSSGEPSNRPNGLPSGSPSPQPIPRTNPNPARPPRNVKERKMKASAAYRASFGTYGFLTETEDVLDAFHKALKKGCGKGVTSRKGSAKAKAVWVAGGSDFNWRRHWNGKFVEWKREPGRYREPSYTEKLGAVWNNFDCVDLAEFWKHYIDNQAEDALFGTASKDDREASKRMRPGVRIGIGTGPAL